MGKFDDDEEIDDIEGEAEGDVEEEGEADTETEASASTGGSSGGSTAAAEDSAEERTVASRQKLREEMAADVEAFLARGGKIAQIEPNVTADPPRKPDSDYGSRPI